jgi:hypothetical protein
MVIGIGPIIPGRPTPAKPAAKTPTRVNTNTLAGIMAASKRPAASTPRYIPSYATPGGKTTKQVTAANNAALRAGTVPTPTRTSTPTRTTSPAPSRPADVGGSSKTGSLESQSAPPPAAEKPIEVVLGQEELDAAQSMADSLRTFQENQARLRLQTALGTIDRAAIDQYKGIANDYAARGMARSGGFSQAEARAVAERNRAVNEADAAVTEFINDLTISGILEQGGTNVAKNKALQDFINSKLKPAMGG